MKVLSLLQPWATLVVIGAKKIETRSWRTNYRGPVLIHASKKMTKEQKDLARSEPFWSKLKHLQDLPLGAIIGKVDIGDIGRTEQIITISKDFDKMGWAASINWETELKFGDYSPGRYGWALDNPISFVHHVPSKGSLGLWDCPPDILELVKAELLTAHHPQQQENNQKNELFHK